MTDKPNFMVEFADCWIHVHAEDEFAAMQKAQEIALRILQDTSLEKTTPIRAKML